MRLRLSFSPMLFILLAFINLTALSQTTSQQAPLVRVIANPEKFDGVVLTLRGFLVLGGNKDLSAHALYLNKEDAENLIGNSILIVPSEQMRRDAEKIDRMYVVLTGTFHVVRAADNSYIGTLKGIVDCQAWSDPSRPIGLKPEHSRKRNE